MEIILYLLTACIVICVFMIWYITTYNKFQEYIIRINEAEAKIDTTLRKRYDLLNKAIGIITSNTNLKEVLTKIPELKNKKLSNFELDRELYLSINEFFVIKEEHDELTTNEEFVKINVSLNESEIEIEAFRRYYNDVITDYNKLVKRFPSNIVALISSYKTKPYFDGKDLFNEKKDNLKL